MDLSVNKTAGFVVPMTWKNPWTANISSHVEMENGTEV
jgi:hypothetical protein